MINWKDNLAHIDTPSILPWKENYLTYLNS